MSAATPQAQRLLEPDRSGLLRQACPWLLKTCFTCLHQLHLPQLPHVLCVWREQRFWQRPTHPRASVTVTPNETTRQAYASTGLTASPPSDTGAPDALLKTLFLKGCWHIILQPQWHVWILKTSTLAGKNVLTQVDAVKRPQSSSSDSLLPAMISLSKIWNRLDSPLAYKTWLIWINYYD